MNNLLRNRLLTSTKLQLNTQLFKLNYHQTTDDLNLRAKQRKFPKLTNEIYIQKEEVPQYDGFKLVEPMIDKTKEPHKLHLIKKIRSIRGEPHFVKTALEKLGFNKKNKDEWKKVYTVKPNTPYYNDLLWTCKHMIKITPVELNNGEPSESDLGYTEINLNTGILNIIREIKLNEKDNIKTFDVNGVQVTKDIKSQSSFPLDIPELRRYLFKKRELQQLNAEYDPKSVEYKYDQDKPGVIRLKGLPDTRLSEDE
jgi:hypothetical protein